MQHLAFIMDGNRRWAKQTGCVESETRHGAQAFEAAVRGCLMRKIPYLTVFALSTENLQQRDDKTLRGIYAALKMNGREIANNMAAENVRIRFVGDKALFDPSLRDIIAYMEWRTECVGTVLLISVMFCYGGQQDIVHASKVIAENVAAGKLRIEDVTAQSFRSFLMLGDIPPPDLMVRTSGVVRLSNFLLYDLAYTELKFIDELWPRLTLDRVLQLIDDFAKTQRNFGK